MRQVSIDKKEEQEYPRWQPQQRQRQEDRREQEQERQKANMNIQVRRKGKNFGLSTLSIKMQKKKFIDITIIFNKLTAAVFIAWIKILLE